MWHGPNFQGTGSKRTEKQLAVYQDGLAAPVPTESQADAVGDSLDKLDGTILARRMADAIPSLRLFSLDTGRPSTKTRVWSISRSDKTVVPECLDGYPALKALEEF